MRHPVPAGVRWTWKYCCIPGCGCEHIKVCANCTHTCDHNIKVCTTRKCNCGRPKVCPVLDCDCGYPKIATSENNVQIVAPCSDPTIKAIARIMESGWYDESNANKKRICKEITERFSGTRVEINGIAKGKIINRRYRDDLVLLIETDCIWLFMCAIEFPDDVNLDKEFPEGKATTITATIREMECQESSYQPILRCN